jgi:hypothetical protein
MRETTRQMPGDKRVKGSAGIAQGADDTGIRMVGGWQDDLTDPAAPF